MSPSSYAVAAFYNFVTIDDLAPLRDRLLTDCKAHDIIGTILLADEGINGTIAGEPAPLEEFLASLVRDPRFCDLEIKRSNCETKPFQRLKVKLKSEIVTFGRPQDNPNERVGTYVEPQAWNELVADPDVVMIDARNSYEIAVGTFPGSLDPGTKSFGELPDFVASNMEKLKSKKIAMFCTGGIRCEKATAHLLGLGFPEVYHLKGGILRYLETMPKSQSLWQGECFVFDERVALTHGVTQGHHTLCPNCGQPIPLDASCACI